MKEARQGRGSRRLTFQISCECVHCVGFQCPKTTTSGKFWLFGGSCTGSLLLMRVTFGVLKQTRRQISSQCVHSVGFRWPKPTIFDKFWLLGASRSVYSIALWRRKTPIFAIFGLRHLVMSTVGGNSRKLNTGAQLQTFPYPAASKSFLFSNVFMAKSGEQTLTFKSMTDRQSVKDKKAWWTDKKLNVFRHPGGGWNLSHTKLGMVIEDLEHVLAPLKRLVVWRIVSPLGALKIWGVTRPHQIKPP